MRGKKYFSLSLLLPLARWPNADGRCIFSSVRKLPAFQKFSPDRKAAAAAVVPVQNVQEMQKTPKAAKTRKVW